MGKSVLNGGVTMMDLFDIAIAKKIAGGGSSQAVLQDKSVSVTENGSQTITPDAGYDGLSRVDVSVNVSGGGGSAPTVGFVPSEWGADGYITNGTWYGKNIPAAAFRRDLADIKGSWQLTNITLPDDLDNIDTDAFFFCNKLSLTTLPSNVRYINTRAFYSCTSLQLDKLPDSLKELGSKAFSGCSLLALTSIDNITNVSVLASEVFSGCTSLQISAIPAQITSIEAFAFNKCIGLTQITFKGTPTSIHMNAFKDCSNLTVINVPWAEGDVANAPWGATNATINYNVTA